MESYLQPQRPGKISHLLSSKTAAIVKTETIASCHSQDEPRWFSETATETDWWNRSRAKVFEATQQSGVWTGLRGWRVQRGEWSGRGDHLNVGAVVLAVTNHEIAERRISDRETNDLRCREPSNEGWIRGSTKYPYLLCRRRNWLSLEKGVSTEYLQKS